MTVTDIEKRIELAKTSYFEYDKLTEEGIELSFYRPMGPYKEGSKRCESGSIASGGTNTYCTCDVCF